MIPSRLLPRRGSGEAGETGLLSRVEVISTVSGGSIVGAAYYLRLRRLLNEKADEDITGDDYMDLVTEVCGLLRNAVRKDIRGRLLANPLKNAEMLPLAEVLAQRPDRRPLRPLSLQAGLGGPPRAPLVAPARSR